MLADAPTAEIDALAPAPASDATEITPVLLIVPPDLLVAVWLTAPIGAKLVRLPSLMLETEMLAAAPVAPIETDDP
jgi:hypothetical protein